MFECVLHWFLNMHGFNAQLDLFPRYPERFYFCCEAHFRTARPRYTSFQDATNRIEISYMGMLSYMHTAIVKSFSWYTHNNRYVYGSV